jgi:hypothetical protein
MLEDAMTEIKDMTGPSFGTAQNLVNTPFDLGQRRKEQGWIEIALHGYIVTQQRPTIVQAEAPIEPDHVSAGALH